MGRITYTGPFLSDLEGVRGKNGVGCLCFLMHALELGTLEWVTIMFRSTIRFDLIEQLDFGIREHALIELSLAIKISQVVL
jgi:hypothetical protein